MSEHCPKFRAIDVSRFGIESFEAQSHIRTMQLAFSRIALAIQMLVVALLLGCATATKEEISKADFGNPPINIEASVKGLMAQRLKDPYSAMYRFGNPRKGVTQDGLLLGGKKRFGWIVPVGINAKNSFGGYTGEQMHYFLFSGNMVYDATAAMGGGMARFLD